MDYSEKLDTLQGRVASAKTAAQSVTSESHEQLKDRIDKAQGEVDRTAKHVEQQGKQTPEGGRSAWAHLRADVATKTGDAKTKLDQRSRQVDAKVAAREAEWAEAEAGESLDFAAWAVANAEVAIIDAIDARLHADELADSANV